MYTIYMQHPQAYDLTSKDIFKDLETALVLFLTQQRVQQVTYLDLNFQTIESRQADLLFETDFVGHPTIFHIEFQSGNDPEMPFRMLRYVTEIQRTYRKPVYQVVIYTGAAAVKMPTELQFHLGPANQLDFRYRLVDFKQVRTEEILALNESAFLPFLPLTQSGENPEHHLQNTLKIVLDKSKGMVHQQRRNLVLKTEILAGLRYSKALIEKIFMEAETMLAIEQSEGYQRILEKGYERGMEKGIQKGLEKGIEKAKLEIAVKLIKSGHTLDQAAELTDISQEILQAHLNA